MRTYTIKQAAEVLQINEETARKLARQGRLQGSKIGRHWRFTERDLEQFLERQRPTRHAETAL
jgi:excisionase family DNA binding protein